MLLLALRVLVPPFAPRPLPHTDSGEGTGPMPRVAGIGHDLMARMLRKVSLKRDHLEVDVAYLRMGLKGGWG